MHDTVNVRLADHFIAIASLPQDGGDTHFEQLDDDISACCDERQKGRSTLSRLADDSPFAGVDNSILNLEVSFLPLLARPETE